MDSERSQNVGFVDFVRIKLSVILAASLRVGVGLG